MLQSYSHIKKAKKLTQDIQTKYKKMYQQKILSNQLSSNPSKTTSHIRLDIKNLS